MKSRAEAAGAQSVRRALKVLRILAAGQEHGVRLTDIALESGLNRPTVHRILRVLAEEGAVEQDPETRRYLVGQEVSLLGLARSRRFPIRAIADPYLCHLSEQVGDTVFLTIRSGFDSICVDRKTGSYPIKVLALDVGARRPLGAGVAGVMLLACLPDEEVTAVVSANVQRLAHFELTAAKLMERVRAARAKGYAYTDAGLVKGTRAVAVAVLNLKGEPLAAISIAAIAGRLAPSRLPGVVALMKEQAAFIRRRVIELGRTQRRLPRQTGSE